MVAPRCARAIQTPWALHAQPITTSLVRGQAVPAPARLPSAASTVGDGTHRCCDAARTVAVADRIGRRPGDPVGKHHLDAMGDYSTSGDRVSAVGTRKHHDSHPPAPARANMAHHHGHITNADWGVGSRYHDQGAYCSLRQHPVSLQQVQQYQQQQHIAGSGMRGQQQPPANLMPLLAVDLQ